MKTAGLFIYVLLLITSSWAQRAKAELINSEEDTVGEVIFIQTDSGVVININIDSLIQGTHSLHIHQTGKCVTPDFKSAGSHFNPEEKEHGFLNPSGPHAGDLPNIIVDSNGKAQITIRTKLITLKKEQKASLLKKGGTSIVIHKDPDDYITQPAGGGGPRIACGAIKEY